MREFTVASGERWLSQMSKLTTPNSSSTPSTRPYYAWIVAGSVLVYWLFVSLIPVYNKYFFQPKLYPYPIATAGIQLGVVALLLGVVNALQHCHQSTTNHSWIGGPHFWWKLRWCTPIGVLFGLKYGVTNLGLHLVPAPTHLLLQATDLVWTVLSAWLINRERLTLVELGCLMGCLAGSIVLSWNQLQSYHTGHVPTATEEEGFHDHHPGLFAIGINLLSPMLLGLCIATLRLACCELMRPENRVRGQVSSIELTSIKLVISSAVALLMALIMERGNSTPHAESWWRAFAELSPATQIGVTCGAFLIAVFQVNCTALTHLTSAVSVGLVGQVKIIPQWILATLFAVTTSSQLTLQRLNLIGALLIMASAATFAASKFQAVWHCRTANRPDLPTQPTSPQSSPSSSILMDEENDGGSMTSETSGLLQAGPSFSTYDGSYPEDFNTAPIVSFHHPRLSLSIDPPDVQAMDGQLL